jgi:hypothetical protein
MAPDEMHAIYAQEAQEMFMTVTTDRGNIRLG